MFNHTSTSISTEFYTSFRKPARKDIVQNIRLNATWFSSIKLSVVEDLDVRHPVQARALSAGLLVLRRMETCGTVVSHMLSE